MRISFHIGAHATDEDQLVKSLLKNQETLGNEGVVVPGPSRYRGVLRDVMNKLRGARTSRDTQDVMLEAMLDGDEPERLVLANESFICAADKALGDGMLYPRAGEKTAWMRNLFPENPVEFFIAVRNPAPWVPALHEKLQSKPFGDFVSGLDPEHLLWSDVIRDIREANPDSPITVWCNEDTPLIWPEVMHEVTGVDPQVQFMGGFDILSQIMAKEGIKRLRSYLGTHPPASEIQRRRVLSAFLDKYALDEEIEEELDLPGWSPELIEQMTLTYDDDMIEIGRIPGVTLLTA